MNRSAPRSIDQYLRQLREELAGADSALIQDALYDAEEYLRAEVAAHPDKSESDVLELIASTYGAPDEVATAYRDTEVKVKAAMAIPRKQPKSAMGRFFGVFLDPRAYTSLFFMLLCLATGIIYFVFAVVGLSLSAGLAVLIIGVPFFLLFISVGRVVSLAEGRLIEAMTGVRMPRRPVYQGTALGFWKRIGEMLKDPRTWTTIAYYVLMLPVGIVYFVIAVVGLAVSLSFIALPIAAVLSQVGLFGMTGVEVFSHAQPEWLFDSGLAIPVLGVAGVLLLTSLMHLARGIGRLHAMFAKSMLVARIATAGAEAAESGAALAAH
ncbi:MAG TPA: sensor domain-containing protein [Steroidobacteraceae bacterium]